MVFIHIHCSFLVFPLLLGDPHITRMVIFAAMLGVLSPVLTLAAAGLQSQGVVRRPSPYMLQQRRAKEGKTKQGEPLTAVPELFPRMCCAYGNRFGL